MDHLLKELNKKKLKLIKLQETLLLHNIRMMSIDH